MKDIYTKKFCIKGNEWSVSFSESPYTGTVFGATDIYGHRNISFMLNEFYSKNLKSIHYELLYHTIKHELIHAFLFECGVNMCSNHFSGPWALNEAMVDWFAHQMGDIEKTAKEIYDDFSVYVGKYVEDNKLI